MLIAMEGLVDYAKRDPSYGSRQPIVVCKSLVVLCCVHQMPRANSISCGELADAFHAVHLSLRLLKLSAGGIRDLIMS